MSANLFQASWQDIQHITHVLARRLRDKGPWHGIVAVTRGGMVPAALLARELNIRTVETVSVIGYEDDKRGPEERIKIVKPPSQAGDGAGWLVVDDLADTGRTFMRLREILPRAHFAALYAKPLGQPFVDTVADAVAQETWIRFPWEMA